MNKLLIVLMLFSLNVNAESVRTSKDCDAMGGVMKAIALMRDSGVKQRNVLSEFRARKIINTNMLKLIDGLTSDIYNAPIITPNEIYEVGFKTCMDDL